MKKLTTITSVVIILVSALWFTGSLRGRGSAHAFEPMRVSRMVSPDGKHVVYGKKTYNEAGQIVTRICVVDTDDGSMREVGGLVGEMHPRYWLGNDRLAIESGHNTPAFEGRYLVMGLDGRMLPDVSLPSDGEYYVGAFSPDGKQLLFFGEKRRWGLLPEDGQKVLDLSTGKAESIYQGGQDGCIWSPDSQRLAIGEPDGHNRKLWILDVETGRRAEQPVNASPEEWSPDGKYIACQSCGDNLGLGLYDVHSRRMNLIHRSDTQILGAKWSRDGKWIAFQTYDRDYAALMVRKYGKRWDSSHEDMYELAVIAATGGRPRTLWQAPYSDVEWADGDTLYAVQDMGKADGILRTKRLVTANVDAGGVRVLDEWTEPNYIPLGWSVRERMNLHRGGGS